MKNTNLEVVQDEQRTINVGDVTIVITDYSYEEHKEFHVDSYTKFGKSEIHGLGFTVKANNFEDVIQAFRDLYAGKIRSIYKSELVEVIPYSWE